MPINRLACCSIRGVARDFIMLKSTKKKNEELREIYVSDSEKRGVYQTTRTRRLVCTFVVRKQQNQGSSRRCIYVTWQLCMHLSSVDL